ncbi:MAG: phosphoglycerate kinase [Patescibacteria group bacterium]
MKLPVLPPKTSLKGKCVFLRVDWNVPLEGGFAAEDSLKISRSIETIRMLSKRGAIVLVATHLGRPKGRDQKFSTKKLLHLVGAHYGVPLNFIGDALDTAAGMAAAKATISTAEPGSVHLLENVRFYAGEEKNDKKLSKAFASLADLFVNDAFASCHRAHASVVGVPKLLPHYAGPSLVEEVTALSKLLGKPKRPYVAVIGGAKITTKIEVLQSLLKVADNVLVGGAMSTAFFAAKKLEIGKSYVEKEGIAVAKKLLKNPKLVLPTDVLVAKKIEASASVRTTSVDDVKKTDAIGDIGTQTMREWAAIIKKAKTIVWNGPLGVTEIRKFSHGSLIIGRTIASRSKGKAYGVAGGGDTLPVVFATGMSEWFDHISTGGGAMLEFIADDGKLPGLIALLPKKR